MGQIAYLSHAKDRFRAVCKDGFIYCEKFHPCSEGMPDNAALFVIKQLLLRRFRHDDVF